MRYYCLLHIFSLFIISNTLPSKINFDTSDDKHNRSYYMLVMNCGSGQDLEDIVLHQNIAGANPQYVIKVAISIAKCRQFLDEKCNIMYGDVKPRNFIAFRDDEY